MDFSYNFHQAQNDRLEDAGLKTNRQQPTEGYVVYHNQSDKHQSLTRRIKQVIVAIAQLLVK